MCTNDYFPYTLGCGSTKLLSQQITDSFTRNYLLTIYHLRHDSLIASSTKKTMTSLSMKGCFLLGIISVKCLSGTMYNISFVFDYMRSMGVAGAYPKVTVDRQHRFVMFDTILHLCNSLSLILPFRVEASQHVISVNDCIPLDICACACNVYQALFSLSPTPNLREPGAEANYNFVTEQQILTWYVAFNRA